MILRKGKVENGNSREKEKEDENSNYIHVWFFPASSLLTLGFGSCEHRCRSDNRKWEVC